MVFTSAGRGRKSLDPVLIHSLLGSAAKPELFMLDAWTDQWEPPPQQGAGIVQVYDATFATTLIEPIHLRFNYTDHFVETLQFTKCTILPVIWVCRYEWF